MSEPVKTPVAPVPAAPPTQDPNVVHLTVNGKQLDARKGEMVIAAAFRAGVYIPHFCWHPGLRPDGNCRMCLAMQDGQKKPIVTCKTPVAEGMVINTEAPEAVEARKGVMEFELINHPLDCPVCDQAGECVLQDYAHEYGRGHGRFGEHKNLRHIKDLGPRVKIWGTRCIVCTRCVRFTEDVSGEGSLTTVNRGDRNVIDIFPGLPLDNELSENTVDICPVGALVSSEFLFSDRWWHMTRVNSLCTLCSKGCNTMAEHTHGEVRRVRPRANLDVNEYWMCDHGREDPKHYLVPERLRQAAVGKGTVDKGSARKSVPTAEAVQAAAVRLRNVVAKHGPGSVAGVVTAFNSCEELYLFNKLMDVLGALGSKTPPGGGAPGQVRVAWGRKPWEARGYPAGAKAPRFQIPADRNPNTPGVRAILGDKAFDLALLSEGIRAGRIKAVFALSGVPGEDPPAALLDNLAKLDVLIVQDVRKSALSEAADVLLAGASPFETDGTFINQQGRIQRSRAMVEPPGYAEQDVLLLQRLIAACAPAGAPSPEVSASAVFDRVAAEHPAFRGLSYATIGDLGLPMSREAGA